MRVKAYVTLLGKVAKPWKDRDGIERVSYSGNVMQENGEIIDTVRLTQEQYNALFAGKAYTITADYGTSNNGGYLRIVDIAETK